jgi:hypothetical protein
MTNNQNKTIIKANGDKELFDVSKLQQSLQKAGADEQTINTISNHIIQWLSDEVTTKKIYKYAYGLLKKFNHVNALKYSLKKALLLLGDTGYPFEFFIGEVFKRQGYKTHIGQIVEGRCITHEVDVIATNKSKQIIIECKYSSNQGKHVGVQVPLYVSSRIEDIVLHRKEMENFKNIEFVGYVVTNTRFSSDAIEYAQCIGLNLIGWDYPKGNGLKEQIEKLNIFPITILQTLKNKEMSDLMNQGIVTCTQLKNNSQLFNELSISTKRQQKIMNEIDSILNVVLGKF